MNGLAGGQKGHIKQKRGFTKQDVNLATGVSIAYLERTRSISATILGGGGKSAFSGRDKEKRKKGMESRKESLDGFLLVKVPKGQQAEEELLWLHACTCAS